MIEPWTREVPTAHGALFGRARLTAGQRVLLDGLCEWMGRKGYTTVEELRGLLAVPVGADETARERGDYVAALRQANSSDYGPW